MMEARYMGDTNEIFISGNAYKYDIENAAAGEHCVKVFGEQNRKAIMTTCDFESMFVGETAEDSNKGFMVSVAAGIAPNKIHKTEEEAIKEAHRLASLGRNIGGTVHVLEVKRIFTSEVIVKEK